MVGESGVVMSSLREEGREVLMVVLSVDMVQ